jgi:hypothetical protein
MSSVVAASLQAAFAKQEENHLAELAAVSHNAESRIEELKKSSEADSKAARSTANFPESIQVLAQTPMSG